MHERVSGGYSLFVAERPELCERDKGIRCGVARVVKCDPSSDLDVIECSKCGKQYTARCTFDDDMA